MLWAPNTGVIGEGLTVTVTNAINQEDAAPMASKCCSQPGREARYKGMTLMRRGHVTSQLPSLTALWGWPILLH